MIIYLYLKTHNITGLKYLGKTNSNPELYEGSGIVWQRHLQKHGKNVSTKILKECSNNEEIKQWGLYYSKKWNIVESNEFANLCNEEGQGGNTWNKKGYKRTSPVKFHRRARGFPVVIDGIEYISMRLASDELGIHHTTISYRARSKNFPNYYFNRT